MNKKISLGIAISLVAIGCAITFVLTWTVSLNIYNSKLGTSEKYEGVYAKLREIDTTVRQNYIGSVSDDSLENATINGYIAGIGDKYASYIAPSAYYELQQTQSGVILGAGFEAEEDTSGYLKITTVYRGSSAELNGVLAGDIITAIVFQRDKRYTEMIAPVYFFVGDKIIQLLIFLRGLKKSRDYNTYMTDACAASAFFTYVVPYALKIHFLRYIILSVHPFVHNIRYYFKKRFEVLYSFTVCSHFNSPFYSF